MDAATLGVWTWIAIGVLVPGSIAVFVWFLGDAVRLFRSLKDDAAPDRAGTGQPHGEQVHHRQGSDR